MATVWAYKRLKALDYHVGYVQCDDDLAAELIESGEVQPGNTLGTTQKPIDYSPPDDSETDLDDEHEHDQGYQNKELTTRPHPRKKRPNKERD